VTGFGTIERMRADEDAMARAAGVLRASRPEDIVDAAEKIVARTRELEDELRALKSAHARGRATELAAGAVDGGVVARVDGLDAGALRELAAAVRELGVAVVVLGGSPTGEGATLVAAVAKDSGRAAVDVIADAARTVGGGAGGRGDMATAGGKLPARIDEALDQVREALGR